MGLSAEKRWIISCLQGQTALPPALELRKVVSVCSDEGVGPLLYSALKDDPDVPPLLIKNLKAQYILAKLNNRALLEEIANIFPILKEKGITPVFLKGSALLISGIYKDIAHRPISDVDFLVHTTSLNRLHKILTGMNYRLDSMEHRKITCLIDGKRAYQRNNIHLDVHWPCETLSLFKSKGSIRCVGYKGIRYQVPAPEVLILHTLQHFIFSHFYPRLIWLIDILRVARSYDVDWDKVYNNIQAYRFNSIFFDVLKGINELFHEPIIPEFVISKKKGFTVDLLTQSKDNPLLAYLVKLANIKGIKKRTASVFSIFFPSKRFISIRYGKRPRFLFHLIRPILMIIRVTKEMLKLIKIPVYH